MIVSKCHVIDRKYCPKKPLSLSECIAIYLYTISKLEMYNYTIEVTPVVTEGDTKTMHEHTTQG